jgi:hypothetical protein
MAEPAMLVPPVVAEPAVLAPPVAEPAFPALPPLEVVPPLLLGGLLLGVDEQAARPIPASVVKKANVVQYFMTFLLEEEDERR